MAAARRLRSAGFFERLVIAYSVAAGVADLSGSPLDLGDQVSVTTAKCARKFDQGVDTRHSCPALQKANLGSVKTGKAAKLFLTQPCPPALTA